MPAAKTGTKRPRGAGSVRQRRRGVWQLRWETDNGIERVYHSETVQGTKTEAEARLRELLAEKERARASGSLSTDPKLTVGQWLTRWLEEVAAHNVRPRTFDAYRGIVRRELIPALGSIRLSQLGVAEVQHFVNLRRGKSSPRWIQHQDGVLRSALAEAERQGLVARNVARLVKVRIPRHQEVQPLTVEEARTFLAHVRGTRLEALYAVTMTLGMRQSEVLGLRWSELDLEAGTLTVRHGLQRYNGEYHLDDVKTKRSHRTLVIPEPLIGPLRAHADRQAFESKVAGWQGADWNLVFCREDGYPLHAAVVTHQFQLALAAAGVRRVRFHDLRHGAATYLLAAGVPMRVVMGQLGHSQMAITSDLYSHVLPEVQRDASERIGNVLFGADI
jgi:integrase